MRITLHIDDEVMAAAKEIARQRGVTLGQIVSELARKSLPAEYFQTAQNGVRIFPLTSSVERPDLQTINELRDEG